MLRHVAQYARNFSATSVRNVFVVSLVFVVFPLVAESGVAAFDLKLEFHGKSLSFRLVSAGSLVGDLPLTCAPSGDQQVRISLLVDADSARVAGVFRANRGVIGAKNVESRAARI